MLVLNPEQNGPAVPLVSLLNNSVNKSPWIAENISPVMLPTIHFVLNHGMLGDLYVRDGIGRFLTYIIACIVVMIISKSLIDHVSLSLKILLNVAHTYCRN